MYSDIYFEHCCNNLIPDEEYMRYLSPVNLRTLSLMVSDFGDRLEYRGSYIFDEYPDREYLYLLLNPLYEQIDSEFKDLPEDVRKNLHDIATVMFICSIYSRRNRFYIHENDRIKSPAWGR